MSVTTENYFDNPKILSTYYRDNKRAFMDDLADPNRRVFAPGDVHLFLGTAFDPFPRPQDHLLCTSRMEGSMELETVDLDVNVTLIKKYVTCQDCIEWMHA